MQVISVTVLKYTSPIAPIKSYITYLPAVIIAVGIAIMSLTESTNMPSVKLNDKLLHGLMYLALTLASAIPTKRYVGVLVAVTLYGALMELLQHYCTLTRSGDLLDLLADFIGAIIGVVCVSLIKSQVIKHKS